jgi:putative Holliday junction resolvase
MLTRRSDVRWPASGDGGGRRRPSENVTRVPEDRRNRGYVRAAGSLRRGLIGVAISDRRVCSPSRSRRSDTAGTGRFARIAEIVKAQDVGQIVIGLPPHMSGARDRSERTNAFGKRVRRRTGVPVDFLDERWTSREAERAMDDAGLSRKKQRGRVDPVAAALLLRTWLELRRK